LTMPAHHLIVAGSQLPTRSVVDCACALFDVTIAGPATTAAAAVDRKLRRRFIMIILWWARLDSAADVTRRIGRTGRVSRRGA
jgi:hypothetical protein